jgi:hypothetical protein
MIDIQINMYLLRGIPFAAMDFRYRDYAGFFITDIMLSSEVINRRRHVNLNNNPDII